MTNNELTARVAAIVATLDELGGTPESNLYIFFDMNMDDWQLARRMLLGAGLVTILGHWVELTAKGRALAARINEATKETIREAATKEASR